MGFLRVWGFITPNSGSNGEFVIPMTISLAFGLLSKLYCCFRRGSKTSNLKLDGTETLFINHFDSMTIELAMNRRGARQEIIYKLFRKIKVRKFL